MTKSEFVEAGLDAFALAGTWNSGMFYMKLSELFIKADINQKRAHTRIERAFQFYLIGTAPSEVYLKAAFIEIATDNGLKD